MTKRLNIKDFNWLVSASTVQANPGQNLTLDASNALIRLNYSGTTYATFDTSFNFTNLPSCSAVPINGPQLINKLYAYNIQRLNVNMYVNNYTLQEQSAIYKVPSVIKTSGITQSIDGWTSFPQVYTFGQSVPDKWIAVGSTTNSLAWSNDGINWTGLGVTTLNTGATGIAWNGYRWVAVGNAIGGNTQNMVWSNDGITWNNVTSTIFPLASPNPPNGYIYNVRWVGNKFIALGYAGANTIGYSFDGINWIGSGTSIFGYTGCDVAYNGNIYVAGGVPATSGLIGINTLAYSSDGITWTANGTAIFTTSCNAVCWGLRGFVAGGSGTNSLAVSADGITWAGLGVGTFLTCNAIDWNGSIFVAVGDFTGSIGRIAYSPNGLSWTVVSNSTSIFSIRGSGIKWNGTKWVAVGQGTNTIAYSLDGINWIGLGTSIIGVGNKISYNDLRPNTITFPRNLTVIGGAQSSSSLAYSSNGTTNYTLVTNSTTLLTDCYCLAWNGYMWLAGGQGNNNLLYSYNGVNWVGLGTSILGGSSLTIICRSVVWGGNKWLALGTANSNYSSLNYSYDGLTWIGLGTNIVNTGRTAIWTGTNFFIGGSGTYKIAYSSDGINWNTNTNASTIFSTDCRGLLWTGRIFIAGGSGTNTLAYSYNGINWLPSTNGNTVLGSFCNSIAWNGRIFVAGGNSATFKLAYSYDGITWTGTVTTYFSTLGVTSVIWNGTSFLAAGQWSSGGPMVSSDDGINWSLVSGISSSFSQAILSVAWNGGIGSTYIQQPIIAAGSGINSLAYSPDGIKWSGLGTNIFTTRGLGVAWNGIRWLALGQGTNSIAYSYDGVSWTGLGTNIFSIQGRCATWNGTIWLAGGDGTNTLAYSSDGLNWTGLGNTNFSTSCYSIKWNGYVWIACGEGTNSLIYSNDGLNWSSSSSANSFFTTSCRSVAWNNNYWVGVGIGSTYFIAYTTDKTGASGWSGTGSGIFTTAGYDITWNGVRFVAAGEGTNNIAYSNNGTTWIGIGTSIYGATGFGYKVIWDGTKFYMSGQPNGTSNIFAYSYDGSNNWVGLSNSTSIFSTNCFGLASNSLIGAPVVDSQLVLNQNGYGLSNKLDVVSGSNYNNGYTNFSATFNSTILS